MTGLRTQAACMKAADEAARAHVIADRFEVWRCRSMDWHDGKPEALGEASSLADAIAVACGRAKHKDVLFIRRIDHVSARSVLSFYRVRQSSKQVYRRAAEDMAHFVAVKPLYLEHIADLAEQDAPRMRAAA